MAVHSGDREEEEQNKLVFLFGAPNDFHRCVARGNSTSECWDAQEMWGKEGLGELDLVLATLPMKSATLDYDKNHITPLF